jgi:hypothetical protein
MGGWVIAYHYTSFETLQAIVDTSRLRLTDALQLNDYTERRWIFEIVRQVAETYKASFSKVFWDAFYADRAFEDQLFTISFSLEDDALSQWRAYADDGAGLSIGFDLDKLAGLVEIDSHNLFEFWNEPKYTMVEYDKDVQVKLVDQVFKWGVDELSKPWFQPALASMIRSKLNVLGVKIKHPSFHEEKETRIIKRLIRIQTTDGGIRYDGGNVTWRNGRYGPTQYTEIDIDVKSTIKRVLTGPRLKGNSAFLKQYLQQKEMTATIVTESHCPYR